MNGKIIAENPESAYSIACAVKDEKAIFTCYTDIVVDCNGLNEITAVNCSRSKTLIFKGAMGKSYTVVDCMGNTLCTGAVDNGLFEVEVPFTAMIFIR